jgi:hypothetical protein
LIFTLQENCNLASIIGNNRKQINLKIWYEILGRELEVPENLLLDKEISSSELIFEIVWGISPDNLLSLNSKVFNRRRLPIDWGINPKFKY